MSTPAAPSYNQQSCWAAWQSTESRFDIFYVCPTFFNGTAGTVMDIHNTRLGPIIKSNIKKNTGIFGKASVYSPFYRQASFKTLFLSPQECERTLQIGYEDIINAFDYFDKHISRGRPFILAGHSQGSRAITNLLKKKFKDSSLQNRLIAAYLPGYCLSLKEVKECPWLRPAQQADDTGVIITFNAQAADVSNPIYNGDAICINPLNWSCARGALAPREQNIGAVFFDRYGAPLKTIVHFTSAYIDNNGFLITPDADKDIYHSAIFEKGIFHVYDYDFFYLNLSANANTRINKYFLSHDVGL